MIPLSSIEKAFWYQQKVNPQDTSNNIVRHLDFDIVLDERKLGATLEKICAAQPQLCARFEEQEDGTPGRRNDGPGFVLRVFTSHDQRAIDDFIQQPFVLDEGALLRCALVTDKVTARSSLEIAVHHIVFDDVSWTVLCQALHAYFDPSAELPVYTKAAPTESSAEHQAYWRDVLDGAPMRIDLPSERQVTSAAQNSGGQWEIAIPESISAGIHELSRQWRVTPTALYASAYALLMYRLSGQNDVVIGTSATVRTAADMQGIGAFMNVLPCRYEIAGSRTFAEFTKANQKHMWERLEHADFSLIELAKDLQHGRQANTTLYNVMFEYAHEAAVSVPHCVGSKLLPNLHAKLDIIFNIHKRDDAEWVVVEYNAAFIAEQSIEQYANYFLQLLEHLVADPSRMLADYSILSSDEVRAIITLGKGQEQALDTRPLWERFETIVKQYPNETAVVHNEQKLTHRELYDKVLTYAAAFHEKGVQSGDIVAIYHQRSVAFLAAMLATWRLGAVYLPLEVKHPKDRIIAVLTQAQPALVFTDSDHAAAIGTQFAVFESDADNILSGKELPPFAVSLQDPTYVIFTSGSTGTPKGVVIRHDGFLNHLAMMIEELSMGVGSRIAQTASAAFDISVWQLICGASVGGCTYIYDDEMVLDATKFYDQALADKIEVLEIVPSLLASYLDAEEAYPELNQRLRNIAIITTGEAITPGLVRKWFAHYPEKAMLNAYGPAEASDDTHFHTIVPADAVSNRPVPIGTSLTNVQTYVLDADLSVCPVGVIGEIYISGIAIASGYFNDPERTKEVFMIDPFDKTGKTRMYKTGDYGSWRSTGVLEYRGRRDSQVKIRGYRIELGEIERQLMTHSSISEVAVIVWEQAGAKKLVAYYTVTDEVAEVEAKNYLSGRLPAYMVPWRCIRQESMPRNSSGKIDRRQLLAMTETALAAQPHTENAPVVPNAEDDTTAQVIAVWARELHTPIQPDTNFFDAGGDSLLCARVVGQLNKAGIHVSIRDLLSHQTPSELALSAKSDRKIETVLAREVHMARMPIQEDFIRHTARPDDGEVQAVLVPITDTVSDNVLNDVLRQWVTNHASLHDSYPSRVTTIKSRVLVEGQAVCSDKSDVAALIEKLRPSLSLSSGHLLLGKRCVYQDEPHLLIVAHHYGFDVLSWPVVIDELHASIRGEATDHATEYAAKAWWQMRTTTISDEALQEEAAYWRNILDDVDQQQLQSADAQSFEVSSPLSPSANATLKKRGLDLQSVVIWALASARYEQTQATSFSYMMESTARTVDRSGDIVNAVGWLAYLYPQTARVGETDDKTAVRTIKRQLNEVPAEGVNYGILRYFLAQDALNTLQEPTWTISYVGGAFETAQYTVIRTPAYKKDAFIEVDIVHNDTQLILQVAHNVLPEDAAAVQKTVTRAGELASIFVQNLTEVGQQVGYDLTSVSESRLADILKRTQQ